MAKKNLVTYGLIAAGVVAAVLIIRKMNKSKKKSSVTADSPIVQSQAEFQADTAAAPEQPKSILETAGTLIKSVFPKKTAVQKSDKKADILVKKAAKGKQKAVQTKDVATKFLQMPRVIRGIEDAEILY